MARSEAVDRPENYLFKTAANVLKDRWRRCGVRAAEAHESYDEALHGNAREALNPERTLLGLQAIEQLIQALYELPERTRVIWALYHLEDLTHAEIARRQRVTISTIQKSTSEGSAHTC